METLIQTIREYVCCPNCQHEVVLKENEYFYCISCSQRYPIISGIPDFRVFDPPYTKIPVDIEMAQKLTSRFDILDHEGLIRFRMRLEKDISPLYPDDLLEAHMQYRLADKEKAEKFLTALNKVYERIGQKGNAGNVMGLDIGCGTGAGMIAISTKCELAIGGDILLSDLVIAKKLLQSEGVNNFFLVCCCAEHLPFKSEIFLFVHSRDVIEHVNNQTRYLTEAVRVLQKGRFFFFNSPNRFMLGLEPHVKLKRVGFLPRRLQPLYVKIRKKETYYERLLSYFELTSMLKKLSLNYKLLNPECRIKNTERSTSRIGQLTRAIHFLPEIINKYYYIFQYEHEMIVFKD